MVYGIINHSLKPLRANFSNLVAASQRTSFQGFGGEDKRDMPSWETCHIEGRAQSGGEMTEVLHRSPAMEIKWRHNTFLELNEDALKRVEGQHWGHHRRIFKNTTRSLAQPLRQICAIIDYIFAMKWKLSSQHQLTPLFKPWEKKKKKNEHFANPPSKKSQDIHFLSGQKRHSSW